MKNLGVILVLLVSTSLGFSNAVAADEKSQKPAKGNMTLALNEKALIQLRPLTRDRRFEFDHSEMQIQVNALLEEKVESKFDALLAAQLEALNKQ